MPFCMVSCIPSLLSRVFLIACGRYCTVCVVNAVCEKSALGSDCQTTQTWFHKSEIIQILNVT